MTHSYKNLRVAFSLIWGIFPLVLGISANAHAAPFSPKVAIVLCPDTYHYNQYWTISQMGSQAFVGLAGLAGVPFDTVTLEELLEQEENDYTSLWFSPCPIVDESDVPALLLTLSRHLSAGGSLLMDGPLAVFSEQDGVATYRPEPHTASVTNIAYNNYRDVAGYAVRTTQAQHLIPAHTGFEENQTLTQGLASGIELVRLADPDIPGSKVLLELISPDAQYTYPFLMVSEPLGGRVAAIANYASFAGSSSIFRNEGPESFFDNQLYPFLLETIFWLLTPNNEPFATLQLSHTNMTTVARLDADQSHVKASTEQSMEYLIQLGKDTGVATVYGVVSEHMDSAAWDIMRPRAQQIEALGGMIASHSHTHPFDMSVNLNDEEWAIEVNDSLSTIRQHLTTEDFQPALRAFINPGNMIRWADYSHFSDAAVDIYLTHGFEKHVLYATGVMNFESPESDTRMLVLNDTPVPDNLWLYDKNWDYTVQEAADIQKKITDYYQHTVKRGVLYLQMQHDYTIANLPPLHYPDSGSNLPLLDVNREHYLREKIYAPSVEELEAKFHIARFTRYSSAFSKEINQLDVTLDFTGVEQKYLKHVAGMGLLINHNPDDIQAVIIDGQNHYAFDRQNVILPPALSATMNITVILGESGSLAPRLTYISKPFSSIQQSGDEFTVKLTNRGLMTKFCVEASPESLVLNSDQYQLTESGEFCGHVKYANDTPVIRVSPWNNRFHLNLKNSDRPILASHSDNESTSLCIGPGNPGTLSFNSPLRLAHYFLNGEMKPLPVESNEEISVDLNSEEAALLSFSNSNKSPCHGDLSVSDEALRNFCAQCSPHAGGNSDEPPRLIGKGGAMDWFSDILIIIGLLRALRLSGNLL